jgi:hypothetical protein
MVEVPAALEVAEWWPFGERCDTKVIGGQLDRAAAAGIVESEDLDMLAQVLSLRGAVTAGVLATASSDDPDGERQRFRTVMLELTHGIVAAGPVMQPSGPGKSSPSVHKTDTSVK